MTISKRLSELKALCDAATPGPWTADCTYEGDPDYGSPAEWWVPETCPVDTDGGDVMNEPNARFIASSRDTQPALIAALEEILAFCDAPEVPSYISIRPAHTGYINRDEITKIIERHLGASNEQS